jgi:hypothetical protein
MDMISLMRLVLLFVQTPSDLYMAIQAKSFPRETPLRPRRGEPRPQTMLFYLDNEVIAEFEADPNYQKYSAITHIQKGIHKIEISLGKPVEFTGLGLAVKCLDITAEPNNITDPS